MTEKATLDQLNDLLKGEISACETYEQAIGRLKEPELLEVFKSNHSCHSKRVHQLEDAVTSLGGQPAKGSGIWGAFAKLMEGGATAFGAKAAIDVLESGERKGLEDYKSMMEKVVTSSTISELLSKQESTYLALSALKQSATYQ